ncbi:hypothetical protein DY000_02013187 [Brassica cretica]|uniref:Uncharacterized protein n=1 Tax=Brassica cretica TaxID=69181 RepID=A0ABQ7CTE6_BRACR|nr:hypothetical protein DY000_02013187 [Brassica cretica]
MIVERTTKEYEPRAGMDRVASIGSRTVCFAVGNASRPGCEPSGMRAEAEFV